MFIPGKSDKIFGNVVVVFVSWSFQDVPLNLALILLPMPVLKCCHDSLMPMACVASEGRVLRICDGSKPLVRIPLVLEILHGILLSAVRTFGSVISQETFKV